MGRDIRFIPPKSLQHVVDNTLQGRYLLVPSEQLNDIVAGILGRAQRKYAMTICAVVIASNHTHLLLVPKDAAQMASFMSFFKTNVAKEVGTRLRNWSGKFFEDRYRSTTVSSEPIAQAAVLRYILSHGPKEGLVARVRDWPGIHSAKPLIQGRPIVGHWYDRTRESRQGRAEDQSIATREIVHLSPLPAFRHVAGRQWRLFVRKMVREIDREWAAHRKLTGRPALGARKVRAIDPEFRPAERKKSPKPRFHAADRSILAALKELWCQVVVAYREASQALREGRQPVAFPEGTFPPALRFVPFSQETLLSPRGRPC